MLRCVRNLFPCVCIILVFAFLFLGTPTHAADLNASVGINPSLTLTLPTSDLNLSLNPATTTFGYKDLPISISTNNETGYIMTVTTADDNTNLVNTSDSSVVLETLPTLAGGYTDSTFVVNKWGYKNGLSNNYFPFTSGATVLENSTYTNEDSTTLRFASKIDYMQEEGTYSTTFSFNLVVNPTVTYMQDMSPSLCTSTPTTVIDKRDNKEYTVTRLADGQCWMTSDLNLAGGTTLNADTSDVPTDNYYALPASSATGFSSDTVPYVYNTGNETTNQADCTSTQPCNSYYSWLAATAGGKDASGTAVTGSGYNAAYSVCPKGWRLPTATTSNAPAYTSPNWKTGDLYKLATAYGANLESQHYQNSAVFLNNAGPGTTPNFLLAGGYSGSTFRNGGSHGNYWSSSSLSSSEAHLLTFNSSYIYSANYSSRRDGYPVRCILKETMQDFGNTDAKTTMVTNASRTLTDSRDGQEYTVKKLGDGNVWMTKDLAIGCNGTAASYGGSRIARTLTSADTNISSTWDTSTATNLSTLGDSLITPGMECDSTRGAWYNYAAVTAGTITGASNNTNATEDICPKGWRLPTGPEQSNLATLIGSSPSSYAPVTKPIYSNKTTAGYADWWSSTASDATKRYTIYYYNNASLVYYSNDGRHFGFYVRCIAK